MNGKIWIALILNLLATAALLIGAFIPYWITASTSSDSNSGLIQVCTDGFNGCNRIDTDCTSTFMATPVEYVNCAEFNISRICAFLSVLLGVSTLFLLCSVCCDARCCCLCNSTKCSDAAQWTMLLSLAASVASLVFFVMWKNVEDTCDADQLDCSFSSAFYLFGGGAILSLIAAVWMCIGRNPSC
jgi:urea transporter